MRGQRRGKLWTASRVFVTHRCEDVLSHDATCALLEVHFEVFALRRARSPHPAPRMRRGAVGPSALGGEALSFLGHTGVPNTHYQTQDRLGELLEMDGFFHSISERLLLPQCLVVLCAKLA